MLDTLLQAVPGADVEAMLLDLRTLASVRAFAAKFKEKKRPLHILVRSLAKGLNCLCTYCGSIYIGMS